MNLHLELLREYKSHYEFEKERILRIQALQDEVQAKATQIILDWIEFEIKEAHKEIETYL